MFLRTSKREDKRRLQQLFYQAVHSVNTRDHTPEQLAAWAPAEADKPVWEMFDQQHSFVVEKKKELLGFASISSQGQLTFLYVHPSEQGKGIGRALLRQIERFARKRCLTAINAEVSTSALSYFDKNGFVVLEEKIVLLRGVPVTRFWMEKALKPVSEPI